ncbi:hypothetical protein [Bifidobacterium cuniculi]|uniref:Uncharacterized protein n=1 Tax=Bifidobacterium cuniculi TaxID=1688 RepID=A0A087B3X9_9BIFI|nr:hypothetical protein [Bifidobacterium cuniculi]KFI65729.1 hypothetical protein BCUN_0224 [Bifidobacterium cuniculi]
MTRHPYTFGLASILGTIVGLVLLWAGPMACANLWRCAVAWLILCASLPGWVIPASDAIARHLSDLIDQEGTE